MSKPRIVALLIGINDYKKYPLKGCRNDVEAMCHFLKQHCDQSKDELDVKCLLDNQASRKNTIETFRKHFGTLRKGDQAFFYFSGHGFRMAAPKAFWDESRSSRIMESYVLHDSRLPGGHDLLDKEFVYLMWKVTQGLDILFTVVADCCYSGGMNKNLESSIRGEDEGNEERHWTEFLGAKEYPQRADGKVEVRNTRHLVFAACREDEKAQEKHFEAQRRGVFTYSLLKALKESGANLTFEELRRRTQTVVYNEASKQHPQLHSTYPEDKNTVFLGGGLKERPKSYTLYFNKQVQDTLPLGKWVINMGEMYGLEKTWEPSAIKLLVFDKDTSQANWNDPANKLAEIELLEIQDNHSVAKVPKGLLDKQEYYQVIFTRFPVKPLKIAFDGEIDAEGLELLQAGWKAEYSDELQIATIEEGAQYFIHAKDNHYWIRPGGEEAKDVFERIKGYTFDAVDKVFSNLKTIAHWYRVKRRSNPTSDLHKSIELKFYEVLQTTPDGMMMKEEKAITDFLDEEPLLKHKILDYGRGAEDMEAMFRLKIKNNSGRRIWYSLIYLSANYSVTNVFTPIKIIEAGGEEFVRFLEGEEGKEKYTDVLSVCLEDAYFNKGIYEITEFVKLMISTHEFSTDDANQEEGVPFDSNLIAVEKAVGKKRRMPTQTLDWTSIDFAIRIGRDKT